MGPTTGVQFTEVKQSVHEADHLHVLLRLRMSGSIPLFSPVRPRVVDRDNFTFNFLIVINVIYVVVNGDKCATGKLLA